MKTLSRRDMVRGMALAGVALPFMRILGMDPATPHVARAGGPSTPRRVVFAYVPDGIVNWEKDIGTGTSPQSFTLGAMLATPFSALKGDVVLLDGLDMVTSQVADTHMQGMVLNLTGNGFQSSCASTKDCVGNGGDLGVQNASIDQYLGKKLAGQAPFGPIQLAGQTNNGLTLSFSDAGKGKAVAPNTDPAAAYATLFGNVAGSGGKSALALRDKLRASVLSNVTTDLTALRGRLGAEDRAKLDQHLASIESMEKQLATPVACTAPGAPSVSGSLSDAANYPAIMQAHTAVLAAAFACDLTRIAVLQFRACYSELALPFAPLGFPSDNIHNQSHEAFDGFGTGYQNFVATKRWHYQQIADFATKLKGTREPTGTGESMLDNTLIVINSDISQGHTHQRMPLVTLGGKNLGVQTGRYLKFASGTPHTNLLVSVLNAMGVPDTLFAGTSTGPLSGFLA